MKQGASTNEAGFVYKGNLLGLSSTLRRAHFLPYSDAGTKYFRTFVLLYKNEVRLWRKT
jgi:hypothetical protein